MSNQMRFEDKVVLITGAATGIGRATALAFARNGAKVAIGDIDDGVNETVELIKENGGEAHFFKTDVTNAEQVEALINNTVEKFGRLDHAFNNAGVLPLTKPFSEMTEKDFDFTVSVDLKGVFLAMKYELIHFEKIGVGTIVNTASVAGIDGGPGMAPYVAAKHGVVGLTKAAGIEYASQGIRVNGIAPGLVETPMTAGWMADPEMRKMVIGATPIGRPAKPEEIAETVLFLSSDASSFTTGEIVVLDGGQTA